MLFFSYWLWPNPAGWSYQDTRVEVLLLLSFVLIASSFFIGRWRTKQKNPITRNLSSGWSTAALWFGLVSLVLTISRVEMIQFMSMRLLWALWFLVLVLYMFLQFVQFRRRHYTVLERTQVVDERDKYLPRKKR